MIYHTLGHTVPAKEALLIAMSGPAAEPIKLGVVVWVDLQKQPAWVPAWVAP